MQWLWGGKQETKLANVTIFHIPSPVKEKNENAMCVHVNIKMDCLLWTENSADNFYTKERIAFHPKYFNLYSTAY